MTPTEKHALYSVLLRLVDDGQTLTPMERRDILNQIVRAACGITIEDILSQTTNKRKLQIKRGTTANNKDYTGLPGELTMDTDGCVLHIHDGQTPGGVVLARADEMSSETMPDGIDYVIETQIPTNENNYTWYRKYKSGWVEQGGRIASSGNQTTQITLPVEMANTTYGITLTSESYAGANYDPAIINIRRGAAITSKSFVIQIKNQSGIMYSTVFVWSVSGPGIAE